ncbi:MAG: ABC transporter permease, partial [Oscillospiraceae bacterium]|nr:ABC transporter permease [Oscillospiraceae bacterium]
MKLSNQVACRFAHRKIKSNSMRSLVLILAIALTSVLFTSLFVILVSVINVFQEFNFKQSGSTNHGEFKYLTEEQFQELSQDEEIAQFGIRRIIGRLSGESLGAYTAEVSFCDENCANWQFFTPAEGRLPAENTNEFACDVKTLEMLGIPAEIGSTAELSINTDGNLITETVTLSGYWENASIIETGSVLLPESMVNAIYSEFSGTISDFVIGSYNMSIMFGNARNIEEKLNSVLNRHGFQSDDPTADNFINIGVNWGYASAQASEFLSPSAVMSLLALLMLIMVSGYLMIYNIFRIYVNSDIQQYGLLKTIGIGRKQLSLIMWYQVLFLSLFGIPLGMLAGCGIGYLLTPVVLSELADGQSSAMSFSPLIFVISGLFSFVTIVISCWKPTKAAGRMSAIDAMRYQDTATLKTSPKKSVNKMTLFRMSRRNLMRTPKKTILTICSLSLSVFIFLTVFTFASGFDMNQYLKRLNFDFTIASDAYFHTGFSLSEETALPEELMQRLEQLDGVTESGRTYGCSGYQLLNADAYLEYLKKLNRAAAAPELDTEKSYHPSVQFYGMSDLCLSKLECISGDLSAIGGNRIAAVYLADDYGQAELDTNSAHVGDILQFSESQEGSAKDFEVVAEIMLPSTMSFRTFMGEGFLMRDTQLKENFSEACLLYGVLNTEDDDSVQKQIDSMLEDSGYAAESKATFAEHFSS